MVAISISMRMPLTIQSISQTPVGKWCRWSPWQASVSVVRWVAPSKPGSPGENPISWISRLGVSQADSIGCQGFLRLCQKYQVVGRNRRRCPRIGCHRRIRRSLLNYLRGRGLARRILVGAQSISNQGQPGTQIQLKYSLLVIILVIRTGIGSNITAVGSLLIPQRISLGPNMRPTYLYHLDT